MVTKLTIFTLLLFSFSCSDQITDDSEGWKFKTRQPDSSTDLLLDSSPDFTTPKDATPNDVKNLQDMDMDREVVDFGQGNDVLPLTDIRYAGLPTGAIRYALSGFDVEAQICIALIVEFTDTFCFNGPTPENISVFIKENATNSECWDYRGTIAFSGATGCVQFDPDPNTNDIQLTIQSPNYNKTVRFF